VSDPWSDLSERVVMVASFSEGDGIGRYADQLAAAYGEGRSFLRVGILWGPGDYHRDYHSGPRALWLLRDARRADDVIVHWHPHYYIRGGTLARTASHLSWGLLSLLRRVTFVHHEPDPVDAPRLEEAARRFHWRRARRVVFHSAWERDRHVARYGRTARQEMPLVVHGDFFTTTIAAGREEARARLGLAVDRVLLLMIGFFSPALPDKGYDRAIAAVRKIGDPQIELHMVGSPIRPEPDVHALVERLREAAREPGIFLHDQFVDDETFDLWIRAADAVLTPYRSASSSGVVARCQMLGTRVITSDVGGLAAQAGPGDIVVADDEALLQAVRRVARGG
jgi:glycosyltransferase involved in cell wall biosynthesis